MAYDPKDPADKKIVDGLIADALAEAGEQHEADVAGLKGKVTELRGKLAKAKAGEGTEGGDTDKLEGEVERLTGELKTAKKDLEKATKSLGEVTTERDGLNKNLEGVLIDQGLSAALTEHKVDTKFLPAVKAMLSPKVALKLEGNDRKAVVGDKSLGDYVKEWSQGDEGKAYVSAAGNSGGGAGGSQGGGQGGGKQWSRAEYDAKSQGERSAFFAEGGKLADE